MNFPDTNSQVRRSGNCFGKAICFLAFLVALAVGLILGAVFVETILPAVPAIIAFAAALAAIIIALLIYRRRCGD